LALSNDLTEGSIHKHLLVFAFPLIISNIMQALYNAVDMYFTGKFMGTEGMTGVSVSGPVINVMLMFVSGFGVGVSVVIAKYLAHGRDDTLKRAANTAVALFMSAAVIISLAGFFLTPTILRLISTPQQAFVYAERYLRIIFCGMIFTIGYNLICALQRGFGDSRSSMYFVLAATLVNIVLDYVFMGIMKMDVSGAAFATVISQGLSFILGIIYFRRKKHIVTFSPKDICFDLSLAKELVSNGLPSAGQQVSVHFSNLCMTGMANSFGLVSAAAYGIAVKLDSFAILPCSAVNDAVASFTAQNLGAGKSDRALKAEKDGKKLALVYVCMVFITIFFFADKLAGIFTGEAAVIAEASGYLRIACFMYFLYAMVYPSQGFLKGSGNSAFVLVNSLCVQYVIKIPIAYVLSHMTPLALRGIAVTWILSPTFSVVTYGRYIKKEKWKKHWNNKNMTSSQEE
jgi:putative MATE family efflux protein